jgi:hypothetical protein
MTRTKRHFESTHFAVGQRIPVDDAEERMHFDGRSTVMAVSLEVL